MREFSFRAPTLYDGDATVPPHRLEQYGAHGSGSDTVRQERFAHWFKVALIRQGFRVEGPESDEEGWIVSVPSNGASVEFVICGHRDDDALFVIDVVTLGPADPAIGTAAESLLKLAPEIRDFSARGI